MKQYIYQRLWLRKTIGILLIIFGVFALIMPLVPGAVLALVGFELVGIRLAFFDRFLPGRVPVESKLDTVTVSSDLM
jgi:hypothetical protein